MARGLTTHHVLACMGLGRIRDLIPRAILECPKLNEIDRQVLGTNGQAPSGHQAQISVQVGRNRAVVVFVRRRGRVLLQLRQTGHHGMRGQEQRAGGQLGQGQTLRSSPPTRLVPLSPGVAHLLGQGQTLRRREDPRIRHGHQPCDLPAAGHDVTPFSSW